MVKNNMNTFYMKLGFDKQYLCNIVAESKNVWVSDEEKEILNLNTKFHAADRVIKNISKKNGKKNYFLIRQELAEEKLRQYKFLVKLYDDKLSTDAKNELTLALRQTVLGRDLLMTLNYRLTD